jgi:hypothetical protein
MCSQIYLSRGPEKWLYETDVRLGQIVLIENVLKRARSSAHIREMTVKGR